MEAAKVSSGGNSWCIRCQHGVPGSPGDLCPKCMYKVDAEGEPTRTVLMTAADAEERCRKIGEATKLARSKGKAEAFKSPKQQLREVENKMQAKVDGLTDTVTKQSEMIEKLLGKMDKKPVVKAKK